MVVGGDTVKGQAKIYGKYTGLIPNTTDGTRGAGGSGGIGGVNGATGIFNFANLPNFNDTDYSNSTDLTATSGGTGALLLGLVGITGQASSAYLNIDFSGSILPQANTPIIIKLTADYLNLVEVQYYNGNTPSGTSQLVSALTPGPNPGEYIFSAPIATNRLRITMKTDVSNGLTAGIVSKNAAKVFYALFIPPPILNATTICSGSQATTVIGSPDLTNFQYNWYNAQTGGDLVNTGANSPYLTNTTTSPILTTYYIEATQGGYSSIRLPVTVTVNPLPPLSITSTKSTIKINSETTTLTATANTTNVQWFDQAGIPLPGGAGLTKTVGPFATEGAYTFTAVTTENNCTSSRSITITAYSPNSCPKIYERVYATAQTSGSILLGGVVQGELAVDNDVKTSSSLNTVVGLLGLGTVWQNLSWSSTIPKGTPVTIKLGPAPSLLALASGISIIAFKNVAGKMVDIGTMQSVDGSLLSLVSGENAFEFTFIPTAGNIPQDYDGVRIQLGAVLSAVQSINVFHAYFNKPATTIDCSKGDVVDILYGAVPLLAGIGALSTTVNVRNPWNAVDNDIATFSTISCGVGVLAYAKEQIVFSSPSLPGDSLRIITSASQGLLNVSLLTGFTIQRYLGNSPVGDPIKNDSQFLSIKLLDAGQKTAIILAPMAEPYDRVEIRLGGVAGVLTSINIHEVQRIATAKVIGSDANNSITICPGGTVQLPPTDDCTKFNWYDENGVFIVQGLTLTPLPTEAKTYKYYIQPVRFGCELMGRGVVTLTINAAPTVSNAGQDQFLCSGTTTTLNGNTPVIGTGTWTIKSKPAGSNPIITAPTTKNSGVTGLGIGSTVFTWTITNATCTPSTSDVTVMVSTPPSTPTVTPTASTICSGQVALMKVTTTDTAGITFNWYITPTGGDIVGTGINFEPVVSTNTTFYVEAYNRTTKCTSTNRKSIIITVVPVPTVPLISATSLAICKGSAAGLSITTPQTGITYNWYDAATDGILLHTGTDYSPTPLQTTTYYIEATNGTCSSPSRASVTVTVNPLPTISIVDGTMSCIGSATSLLNYTTTTGSQLKYSIIWNTAGFSNVPETTLPASPIHLTIPFDAPLGSHTGTLTLKDGITGCTSTYPISVEVKPRIPSPTISIQ